MKVAVTDNAGNQTESKVIEKKLNTEPSFDTEKGGKQATAENVTGTSMDIVAIGIDPEAVEGGEQTLTYKFYWGTEAGKLVQERSSTNK